MWRTDLLPTHARPADTEADVCLIAEGCYPYVSGGVSSWIDWLIRSHPDLTFSVLAILPSEPETEPRYARPDNLLAVHHLILNNRPHGGGHDWPHISPLDMADLLAHLLHDGHALDYARLIKTLGPAARRPSLEAMLDSNQAWQTMCRCYEAMPHAAFLDYFWAWRTLVGGLFRVLTCPLPSARIYHAVSTGYAGLIGARAALETGRSFVITEHGIYSNERRIEILMADWIANSIDTGLDLSDERKDIRELWARGFESFARTAYGVANEIVALYEANQVFQSALGARSDHLRVIPNGVDIERFGRVERVPHDRPTIAFIGRITPIKDIQTFIDVVESLREQHPDLEALILGPMDEDREYAEGCIGEVQRRHLDGVVTFTGPVDITDYLGSIDVLVLTSISEALPLVILEAGAAGIPCVATDVGACREILEGRGSHGDGIGPGGMVAQVGASDEIADAVSGLLSNKTRRNRFGRNLRQRVVKSYRAETIADEYTQFYRRNMTSATLVGG